MISDKERVRLLIQSAKLQLNLMGVVKPKTSEALERAGYTTVHDDEIVRKSVHEQGKAYMREAEELYDERIRQLKKNRGGER